MSKPHPDHSPVAAVLLEKDGRFFFCEPGLAVIASGDSVEGAYEKFIESRRGYLEDFERAGLNARRFSYAQLPGDLDNGGKGLGLKAFLAKTCIVLLLIVGIGAITGLSVAHFVGGIVGPQVEAMGSISMEDVVKKVAVIAQDFQSLPDDRKETLKRDIGLLSREATMFIDAWRNPPPKADMASPPAVDEPRR